MPKFLVVQYFTSSKTFEVEAENAAEASKIVNASDMAPIDETGAEFSDEIANEVVETIGS